MATRSALAYLLLSLIAPVCQAQTAYLETPRIVEGDVATLVVEYQNNTPSLFHLDTTPLEKSFLVLEVKPNVLTMRENNQLFNVMRWKVQLYPLGTGRIKISSLNIRGSSTPEISLDVVDRNLVDDHGEQIFIEVTADPEDPYIGEQSIITIQLIHNRELPSGRLTEAVVAQADTHRIGSDTRYSKQIDGETFAIIERRLALFAHNPGSLVYPAVEFWGEVESLASKLDGGEPSRRKIRRESRPVMLAVRAPPPGFSGDHWLPARDIRATQQWHGLDRKISTGDSVVRSLTIHADGLSAENFPDDLFAHAGADFTVYADKAEKENSLTGERMTGLYRQAHAIILTRQGEIRIPDISIKWWDVVENIEQEIILAGETLMVSPAATKTAGKKPDFTARDDINDDSSMLVNLRAMAHQHQILLLLLGLIAGLACCHGIYTRFRTRHGVKIHFSQQQLKQACLTGDAAAARAQLIAWAREQWPGQTIAGLHIIKTRTDSLELRQQLTHLDAELYGHRQGPWQGRRLWQAFVGSEKKQSGKTRADRTGLPDLYPL